MESTFFLPVGRVIAVELVGGKIVSGVLKGVVNIGGIPAIWLNSATDENLEYTYDYIALMNNVCYFSVLKDNPKTSTKLILEP